MGPLSRQSLQHTDRGVSMEAAGWLLVHTHRQRSEHGGQQAGYLYTHTDRGVSMEGSRLATCIHTQTARKEGEGRLPQHSVDGQTQVFTQGRLNQHVCHLEHTQHTVNHQERIHCPCALPVTYTAGLSLCTHTDRSRAITIPNPQLPH